MVERKSGRAVVSLAEYLQHQPTCRKVHIRLHGAHYPPTPGACTCGLDDAVRRMLNPVTFETERERMLSELLEITRDSKL